jgi:hypothetical protein
MEADHGRERNPQDDKAVAKDSIVIKLEHRFSKKPGRGG